MVRHMRLHRISAISACGACEHFAATHCYVEPLHSDQTLVKHTARCNILADSPREIFDVLMQPLLCHMQVDRSGWDAAGGGTNALSPGVSYASGWLLETILTCVLVFVVLAATDSNRSRITAHLPARPFGPHLAPRNNCAASLIFARCLSALKPPNQDTGPGHGHHH